MSSDKTRAKTASGRKSRRRQIPNSSDYFGIGNHGKRIDDLDQIAKSEAARNLEDGKKRVQTIIHTEIVARASLSNSRFFRPFRYTS